MCYGAHRSIHGPPSRAQSIFALRTLRSHGTSTNSLQTIFQATVVAKLSYASSAWWGFANQADRSRLVLFLRRSERLRYRESVSKTLSDVCELADAKLFNSITNNESHLLYILYSHRSAVNHTPYVSERTRFNLLLALLLSMTITSPWKCCTKTWTFLLSANLITLTNISCQLFI